MPLLSLIPLLLSAPALAGGTAIWLDRPPDPTRVPGVSNLPVERILPQDGWTEADQAAIDALRRELDACAPLITAFDGEVQIMRRLEDALARVHALREEDRDLVWRALVLQGFAVYRYFQAQLSTDPSAAPYRVRVGEQDEPGPWVDAVALDADRLPDASILPELPERVAYEELRSRLILAPSARVSVAASAAGATLEVDGLPAGTGRIRLRPGRHRLALLSDGVVLARLDSRIDAGASLTVAPSAGAEDFAALDRAMEQGARQLGLSAPVLQALEPLEAPVYLVGGSPRRAQVYRVEGAEAHPIGASRPQPGPRSESGVSLRAAAGGGWMHDPDWALLREDEATPWTTGTVNAGATVFSLGGQLQAGALLFGLGADLLVPLGEHHTLPSSEDARSRLRAWPHLLVGAALGPAELGIAAGPFLPWQLGIGPRLALALPWEPLELTAGFAWAEGLSLERDDGSVFEASSGQAAWLGIGGRLDLGAASR